MAINRGQSRRSRITPRPEARVCVIKMADNEEMELEELDEENDDDGSTQGMGDEDSSGGGVFIPGKTQHDGGELESDPSAYIFLHQLQAGTGYPLNCVCVCVCVTVGIGQSRRDCGVAPLVDDLVKRLLWLRCQLILLLSVSSMTS